MKLLRLSILFITLGLLWNVVLGPVWAEDQECTTTTGSYGQTSTTCKVLGVTHEPVKTGIGDMSFLFVASVLSTIGLGAFGLAKLAERTYWLD